MLAPIQNRVLGFALRCFKLNLGSSGLPEASAAGLPLSAGWVVENAERCTAAGLVARSMNRGAAAQAKWRAMICEAIIRTVSEGGLYKLNDENFLCNRFWD